MARPVVITINTVATLTGIDNLISRIAQLGTELKETARIASASGVALRGLSTSTQGYSRAAATAARNTANLTAGLVANNQASARTNAILTNLLTVTGTLAQHMQQQAQAAQTINRAFGITNTATTNATRSQGLFSRALTTTSNAMRSINSALDKVLSPIRSMISIVARLAQMLGSALKAAFQAAGNAAKAFAQTASSAFAGLQRAVNGIQGVMKGFTSSIQNAFATAQRHMRDFYNAGWSLLTSGRAFQNVGQEMWGGLTGMFEGYMDFEKAAARTAISASTDVATIQELVFNLQQGAYTGGKPLMQFDAAELAQGLYYYTSAIGAPVTAQNMEELGTTVGAIMQMAANTQTSLETATKGVLNAVMEFGINPRDVEGSAETLKLVASQFGYLANLTTMEVPDIAEAFKMVGPLMHVLSGDEAGAGLNEAFGLIALASDVGLRGGNVGRGINQLMQTILSPTNPAIEAAAEAFGIGASEEAWKAFFLNSDETLVGGVEGLFAKLEQLTPSQMAKIFTTNATRALVGITEAAEDFSDPKFGQGLEGFFAMMRDPDASLEWLSRATAVTSGTIAANFQNIKNAWFQAQASIVGSVKSTLLPVMQQIADVIFRIGNIIRENPWVGKLITSLMALAAVGATVVGSIMMIGGSLLLVMKAFALISSISNPFLMFLTSIGAALLTIIPLVAAVAGAVLFMRRAWEENLYNVQERVEALKETLMEFFGTANTSVPNRAMGFFKAYEDASYNAGLAIIEWGKTNREQLMSVLEFLQDVGRGFVAGFLGTVAAIQAAGTALANFIRENIGPFGDGLADIIENMTGARLTVEDLAHAIGAVLGGAFAVLIFKHFVPAIAMTVALRGSMLLLNGTMFVLSTTAGLVSQAFALLATIIGVITGLTTAMSLLGAVGVAAVALLAVAFIDLWRNSQGFADDIKDIFWNIVEGLKPIGVALAGAVAIGFGLVKSMLEDFVQTLKENEDGVRRLATIVGGVLLAAFVAFGAVAVGAIYLVMSGVEALVKALEEKPGLDSWLGDIQAQLRIFADALSLGTFDMEVFKNYLGANLRIIQHTLELEVAKMLQNALTNISDFVAKYTGLNFLFEDVLGIQFDPDLGKAVNAKIAEQEKLINTAMSDAQFWADEQLWRNTHPQGIIIEEEVPAVINVRAEVGTEDGEDLTSVFKKLIAGELSMDEVYSYVSGLLSGTMPDGTSFIDTFMSKMSSDITNASGGFKLSDILQTTFDEAVEEYGQYQGLVDRVGVDMANSLYEANNMPIPTDPGPYERWVDEQVDDLEEGEQRLQDQIDQLNKSVLDALTSMDIQSAAAGMFGEDSVASIGLQVFEQVKTNLGDTAPWMNETEFLADLAISGLAGEDISGQNIHRALAPALEGLSQETGLTITEILKGIPKYIVPEEYVPLATAELAEGIGQIGSEADRQWLDDSFGTDLWLDETGSWATDVGIDWAELTSYAIGQSIEGNDWNLANYMAESWGISVEEAEKYLKDHGIDPGIISDAWFDDTEMLARSLGGQVSLITEEWYNWLQGQLDFEGDMTVEISEADFDALPDYVKLGLTGMGYTFVITGKVNIEEGTAPAWWTELSDMGGGYASGAGFIGTISVPTADVPSMPGVPTPSQAGGQGTEAANAYITSVNEVFSTAPVVVDTSPFATIGTTAGNAFKTAFEASIGGLQTVVNTALAGARTAAGGSQSADGQIYSDAPRPQATSGQTVTITFEADVTGFNTEYTALNTKLIEYDTHGAYNATLGIDTVALYTELYGVTSALDAYDTRPASNATVGIVDYASLALQNIINKLNEIDGRIVTSTIRTVTSTQELASGGIVDSAYQLVGERGPEIVSLPQGSNVTSTSDTFRMLQDAVASASNPRDTTPVTSSSEFRQAANWVAQGMSTGGVEINIDNINIDKEVDVDAAYARIQRLMGRDNAMAMRGMVPADNSRTL